MAQKFAAQCPLADLFSDSPTIKLPAKKLGAPRLAAPHCKQTFNEVHVRDHITTNSFTGKNQVTIVEEEDDLLTDADIDMCFSLKNSTDDDLPLSTCPETTQ